MSRARGKQHRPPEISPDSPEGHEIGLSDKDIPGGIYHQQNYPTVHAKPEVGDPLPEFRGMMTHGVPPEEHGVYDRHDGKKKYAPEYVKLPDRPAAVPVYVVEDASGSRPLLKTSVRHFQVPALTSEPESICGQDANRRSVRILNEGVALGSATSASGSVTNPGGFASIAATGTLPVGTYQVTGTVFLSGTVTSADANNMQVALFGGTTAAIKLAYPGVANSPVTYSFLLAVTGSGQQIGVQTIGAASGASAVYNASVVCAPVSVGKGVRVGQLPELAVDLQNSLIAGGAILPNTMASYLEIRTQGPLYVLSMDTNTPYLSVIIETEVPNAGLQ